MNSLLGADRVMPRLPEGNLIVDDPTASLRLVKFYDARRLRELPNELGLINLFQGPPQDDDLVLSECVAVAAMDICYVEMVHDPLHGFWGGTISGLEATERLLREALSKDIAIVLSELRPEHCQVADCETEVAHAARPCFQVDACAIVPAS